MTYEEIIAELDRIEAETGCELPELSNPTIRQRAEALLECDDPPKGADLAFVQAMADVAAFWGS